MEVISHYCDSAARIGSCGAEASAIRHVVVTE
jgi:hypothetical protein